MAGAGAAMAGAGAAMAAAGAAMAGAGAAMAGTWAARAGAGPDPGLICSGRSQILWPRMAAPLAHSEHGGGHEEKLPLPPEQVIRILGDDSIRRRRTQNAYSNDARRRIVQMKKEMHPDRRFFSLHEQKAFGDVGRFPASRVGITECDKFYRGTHAAQSLAPLAGGSLTARCGNDAS